MSGHTRFITKRPSKCFQADRECSSALRDNRRSVATESTLKQRRIEYATHAARFCYTCY